MKCTGQKTYYLFEIYGKVVNITMLKNILKSSVVLTAVATVVTMSTLAAFTASATVNGNTFSTGTVGLKLFTDLAGTSDPANLTSTKDNTVDFMGIMPLWSDDYAAKVHNSGTVPLDVEVEAVVEVDDDYLADAIMVDFYLWDDTIGVTAGVAEPSEITWVAEQSLLDWETTPFVVATPLAAATTQGVYFEFEVGDLDNTYQNRTVTYDFVFNGETPVPVTPTPAP